MSGEDARNAPIVDGSSLSSKLRLKLHIAQISCDRSEQLSSNPSIYHSCILCILFGGIMLWEVIGIKPEG